MSNTKQLLKILIAAAWLDGAIQPEERKYFHNVAKEHSLADDPEIKTLLLESTPVKPEDCYRFLEEYLGTNPTQADYEKLIESVSAIVYSDGNVEIKEAELLTKIQNLAAQNESPHKTFDKLLKTIQKLYQKAVKNQA